VKSADLTIASAGSSAHWNLVADPSGVFYKSPKEDKLLTLNGGTFNLDKKSFKLTNITGLLGTATPFKLNGTGGVVAAAPIVLNAVAQNVDLGTARKLLAVLAIKLPASRRHNGGLLQTNRHNPDRNTTEACAHAEWHNQTDLRPGQK